MRKLVLETAKFNVLTAHSSREALDLFHLFPNVSLVILVAGTGNPYFTTDTAAALRAVELRMDVLLKATKVAGVYEYDPHLDPSARRFETLTYMDALNRELGVMDAAAISLLKDNGVPIIVFNLAPGNIERVVLGEPIGTLIAPNVGAVLAGAES